MRRPIQFSLRSLLCLIVGLGSVLAALLPHGAYAPLIGWVLLAAIYHRQGWDDLLFVHGVLPAISLSMLAILVIASIVDAPLSTRPFWDGLTTMAYWLLFVSCLAANILSQFYYVYLLAVVGPSHEPD